MVFTVKKSNYFAKNKTVYIFFGIKIFTKIKTSTVKYYIFPWFVVRCVRPDSVEAREKKFRQMAPKDYARFFAKIAPKNPQTINEKIRWLGIYDATPLKTRLADKYLVRQWVQEQVGERYLIPLLGVWDSFDEIDFSDLPDQFILKCNHGCGWNIAVPHKDKLDRAAAKQKFDLWLRKNLAFAHFELQYLDIAPKIIAEKFLRQDAGGGPLFDHRFWVIHGKPEIFKKSIVTPTGNPGLTYTTDGKIAPVQIGLVKEPVPKPQCLDEMLAIAAKLAAPFCFVRVDLYEVDGKVYFGEMTFTPAAGGLEINPPEYDLIFGKMLTLPKAQVYQPRS